MASYAAYTWVPWQEFCSTTALVGGIYVFATSNAAYAMTSKGTPISSIAAIDGLWPNGANKKAAFYIPSLADMDVTGDIELSIEFYLASGATSGQSAQLTLKYVPIVKGVNGTSTTSAIITAIAVPLFTVGSSGTWTERMYSIGNLVISGYTFTSSHQGLVIEVGTSNIPGDLITNQKIAIQGVGINYSSTVMEN